MATITITILDATGEEPRLVDLPNDVLMRDLRQVLLPALGKLILSRGGQPISYRFYSGRREISDRHTLEQAGVADGDTITLSEEAMAGSTASRVPIRVHAHPCSRPGAASPPPSVHLVPRVLQQLEDHATSHPYREVGGLLLGTFLRMEATQEVQITAAIPAQLANGGTTHLHFTHDAWAELREVRAAEHPDKRVVGWYHTHPGLGLFLSELDRELHAQIFGLRSWAVALVLDPREHSRAFFWPSDGQVFRCGEYPLRCEERSAAASLSNCLLGDYPDALSEPEGE